MENGEIVERITVCVSDDELMLRFKSGELAAFEEIYDRYGRPLYGFCARILGDATEAEDALQDVFTKVVDRRGSFEPRGRFRSWVFTIARFTCLDYVRARENELLPRELAGGVTTPDDQVVLAREELRTLLLTLPLEQREVLVLHRLHGFSHAEIAEMLSSTEAAVRQKTYRALKSLRARAAVKGAR